MNEINGEIKLKPCPFCGVPGKIRIAHSKKYGDSYAASCSNLQCDIRPCSQYYATREQAVLVWNKRARPRTKRKKEAPGI